MRSNRGFTLLELLVVIALIGLLATITLASLQTSRKKARDARRLADMRQIRTALEMYYNDYNTYPPAKPNTSCGGTDTAWADSVGTCGGQWLTTDANFYAKEMVTVPVDPMNAAPDGNARGNDNDYVYTYIGYAADYDLIAQLELTSNPAACANTIQIYHGGNVPWCPPWANNIGRSTHIIADH